MKAISPGHIAPPFGAYSHGILSAPNQRLLVTSGQLGLSANGEIPAEIGAQADICFANITAILSEAGASPANVLRLNAYVTDRAYFAEYMEARDRWLAGVPVLPASTLMIVSGFTRPEFMVEVEATAALSD